MSSASQKMESYFDRLWPICRSLTGEGFRSSLSILQEIVPFEKLEIPTGTQVFDWTVPREWNISDAYVEDESGRRIIDFKQNNLHVLGYSVPVDKDLSLEELNAHLYSLPEKPKAIPYHTSYYSENWGFCLSHEQRQNLKPGKYRAVIRSTLEPGALTIGHCVLPSTSGSEKEILLSSYLCHPSMANNELSGPLVLAMLYLKLSQTQKRNYNYRFVLCPETIGSIAYLSKFGEHLKTHCIGGFQITCCGDAGPFNYKKTRDGNTMIDWHAVKALKESGKEFKVHEYWPTGSDERQYSSPAFNLAIGSVMRSIYGHYPQYHSSLDDKSFVSFEAMAESTELYWRILSALDRAPRYLNLQPHCEPMLSKHGLYSTLSGQNHQGQNRVVQLLYLLNYSDGKHDLDYIADRLSCAPEQLDELIEILKNKGFIRAI